MIILCDLAYDNNVYCAIMWPMTKQRQHPSMKFKETEVRNIRIHGDFKPVSERFIQWVTLAYDIMTFRMLFFQDILHNERMQLDKDFKISLVSDIVQVKIKKCVCATTQFCTLKEWLHISRALTGQSQWGIISIRRWLDFSKHIMFLLLNHMSTDARHTKKKSVGF